MNVVRETFHSSVKVFFLETLILFFALELGLLKDAKMMLLFDLSFTSDDCSQSVTWSLDPKIQSKVFLFSWDKSKKCVNCLFESKS